MNAIAPIRTVTGGAAWRLPTYYPVRDVYRLGQGVVLEVQSSSPGYDNAEYGVVPFLEATATLDEERAQVVVFAVNRSQDAPLAIEGDLEASMATSCGSRPLSPTPTRRRSTRPIVPRRRPASG